MKIAILGAGESGVGTALLAKKIGYEVFVSDFGKIKQNYKDVLTNNEINWEEEQHTEHEILSANLVMKSPGIPDKVAIIKKIIDNNIEIVSEIEFVYRHGKPLTIGITGSNGKTTTTLLTYHILKYAGLNVGLAGNIGKSFAWQIAENNFDIYVLELSSFQLDGISQYKPHIAIITNLSPDHLDRYDYDYKKYINAKFKITKNQTKDNYLIFDDEDVEIQNWFLNNQTQAIKVPFSLNKTQNCKLFLKNNNITSTLIKEENIMPLTELSLEGKHNAKNAMAAIAVAQLMKIRNNTIRESMSNFQGVEHRLEKVSKINGVQFINDSKATNVNSVFFALDSMTTPTVWIAGGVDKGNDYEELMPLVREKVKAIICLGIDNTKIVDYFDDVVDLMIETTSIVEAVKIAQRIAESGDTVLLSPACASFDLFENYEDRGKKFKEAVKNLA